MPIYIVDPELTQLTREALWTIKRQYDELIIIDDASPLSVGEFKDLSTFYVENYSNEGYIRSVNKGIRLTTNDYICVVCNDTKLMKGSLDDLCDNGYRFPVMDGKALPFWDGAFYCFPKKIGGLYDERYTNYFGDLDKFYDAKMKGISLEQVPKVTVWHKQSATTNKTGIRNKAYEEDYQKFIKKWGFDPLQDYYYLI